jgi:hypothetical protein|tara:strand:+ start:6710 stop:7885 length:1176 start_codon:yes stop_codon:yes gene_type:complete
MSKIFKRPMFRRGGNVGTGIMTGIVDRTRASTGYPNPLEDTLNTVQAPKSDYDFSFSAPTFDVPESRSLDNLIQEREKALMGATEYKSFDPLTRFLLTFGPAYATETRGGGGIGRALAASQKPLAEMIKEKDEEAKFKRGIRLKAVDSAISARDVTEKEIRDVKRLQEKANTEAENLAREAKNKVLAAKDLSESQRDKALAEIEARKNAQIEVNKETAKLEAETKDPFDSPVYSAQYENLSKEIEGATPNVVDRATNFRMDKADDLRAAVGASRSISGGVATFDVSDPNNKEALKQYRNKVVYDPFDDNYKYIVFDKDTKQYSFQPYETIEEVKIAFADSDPAGTTSSNVAQETEEDKKKRLEKSYGFYLPDVIKNIQEKDKEIPIGGTGA